MKADGDENETLLPEVIALWEPATEGLYADVGHFAVNGRVDGAHIEENEHPIRTRRRVGSGERGNRFDTRRTDDTCR